MGAPAAGGVVVVAIASIVCPFAGGCTTVVVVVPFLSTETTCCGCPVAAACCLAWSSALSCFDSHPDSMAAANTSIRTGIRPGRTNEPALNIINPRYGFRVSLYLVRSLSAGGFFQSSFL